MTSLVVAVLTFRRNVALTDLLPELLRQVRELPFEASVLVVDNDPAQGARPVIAGLADPLVCYVTEPVPGIAAGRNRALVEAEADLLAFIDDDERPTPRWLATMVETLQHHGVEAVVGPVVHEYETPLDPWIVAGGFLDRPRYPTGTPIPVGATNNLLLDLREVHRLGLRFDADFGISGGSDTLFTKQFTGAGKTMVWCDDAPVLDPIPSERATREWVVRRSFRLGNTWSRVLVRTAGSPRRRVAARVRIGATGMGRTGAGVLQLLLGLVTASIRHRAHGIRLISRGAGLVSGALGYAYLEYRRPVVADADAGSEPLRSEPAP